MKIAFVLFACVLILLGSAYALRWIALQQYRAKLGSSQGRFDQLEVALRSYHFEHGEFPPSEFRLAPGSPRHSWRILLLPHLDLDEIRDRYSLAEPWNSEQNLALASELGHAPLFFRSPFSSSELSMNGDYFLAEPEKLDTYRSRDLRTRIVKEGPHEVIIVEVPDSKVHWMSPDSPTFNNRSETRN